MFYLVKGTKEMLPIELLLLMVICKDIPSMKYVEVHSLANPI